MRADTINNCKLLIGCFVIDLFISGAARLSSIYFVESITRYNVDRNQASFPFVLIYMVKNFSGPLVGYAEQILGTKWLITIGCILSTFSIGFCFFAEDILVITLLWGVVLGLSFGFAHNMQAPLLNHHFINGKSKANSFVLSGSCVGGILLPAITTACIQSYGTSGSFLVLAAIIAHTIPASLLIQLSTIRPLRSVQKENVNVTNQYDKKNDDKNDKHIAEISYDYKNEKHTVETFKDHKSDKHNAGIFKDHKNEKNNAEITNDHMNDKDNDEINNDHKNDKHNAKISNITGDLSMIQIHESSQNISSKSLSTSNSSQNSCRDHANLINESPAYKSYFLNTSQKEQEENKKECGFELPKEKNETATTKKELDIVNKFNFNKRKFTFRYFRIFIDPAFIAILIINGINVAIITTVWTIILDFVRDKGVPESLEIYYVVLLPVTDLIGRLGAGYFSDKRILTVANFCLLTFLVQTVTIVVIVYLDNYIMIMVCEMLLSLCLGMTTILDIGMTHEFVEEESRKMAMSCRITLYGPLSLTISPMIGYFRGGYGSYDNVFHILSVGSLICGLTSYILPHLKKKRRSSISQTAA